MTIERGYQLKRRGGMVSHRVNDVVLSAFQSWQSRSPFNESPNKALQPTAAAVLVCQGNRLRLAAAAAELGR
jgi:hypothetical protein